MKVDVVFLPAMSRPEQVRGRAVVVFDVLRATTSMTAALAAGVERIHVFGSLDEARNAAAKYPTAKLLCGEMNCLQPEGFDLGNSPGAFVRSTHAGATMFMSTTNGTRSILAAHEAEHRLIGALVNAEAVAKELVGLRLDATLLCAGTNGDFAIEDVLGAGAVLQALTDRTSVDLDSDRASIAKRLFEGVRENLPEALRESRGGQNILAAHLDEDIEFAARLDVFDCVGRVRNVDGFTTITRGAT